MSSSDRTPPERQPSLHDIAEAAGLSVSTVSRYLSGQLPLKPQTESRLLETIDTLGYVRSPRQARRKPTRNGVIGLVVPQIGNTYFGRIADAVVSAAESHGLAVLLTSTLNHSRKQLDYVDLLVSKDIAGLIYAGNFSSNRALSNTISSGLPVVVIDEAIAGVPPVDTVLVDDYAGAYHATTYLTTLGHTRIALVTGPTGLRSVSERRRGWRDALQKAGIRADDQVVLSGAFSEEFGVVALSHLLSSTEIPTAVFAASDTIALGIMAAAHTLGVSIPGTLSVVGFDDAPAAGLVTPRLTTLRTPLDKMASNAVTMLVDRIDDSSRPVQTSVTPVTLIVGESAAALRA
ncbi:MAG: LacI family transcriptional regulator, repressor for deo operon, udp, cdd, tsx, nupC, and nupG [Subtercola sp.]|nr:LacI family transcriptional regulator, repressor for deo operon, udp, cdd, tsx, nupC, and nupG [Subtercola sp.]